MGTGNLCSDGKTAALPLTVGRYSLRPSAMGRRYLKPVLDALRPVGRWLMHGRKVAFLLLAFGFIDLAIWTAFDIHDRWDQDLAGIMEDEDGDGQPEKTLVDAVHALWSRTVARAAICLAPGFIVWVLRRRQRKPFPILPAAWVSLFLILALLPSVTYHGLPEAMASKSGDQPYKLGFFLGIALLGCLFVLPPVAVWLYRRGTLLDRYMVRSFLTPFLLCFFGFLSIWLISDMSNNGADYAEADMSTTEIFLLYLAQIPAVIVLILPITLLLAILYALGRMSRRNELVSMMMAGISVPRLLLPIFLIGGGATFVSLVCNYQLAPSSVGSVESLLDAMTQDKKARYAAYDQAFMNRVDNRLWFVGMYPHVYTRDNKMEGIMVVQFDDAGIIRRTIQANRAFWQRHDGLWVFWEGQVTEFNEAGEPVKVTTFPRKHFEQGWSETPWKLVSSGLNPEFLGLPQLHAYLQAYRESPPDKLAPFLTHWHYRLALPFECLAAVLFGAPLGIVYSRRGLVGSVTAAVGMFFALLFVSNFSVALGQGFRIPALPAAWLPALLFSLTGIWLIGLRAHNREIPSPTKWVRRSLGGLFRRKKHATA